MYGCASRLHGSVRMCACMCMRARRGGGMPICTKCVCIDAWASRHVRMPRCAHTQTSAAPPAFICSPSPRACAYGYIFICVYRELGMDRCASVCIHMYIYSDIYMFSIFCTYTYACTWVCTGLLRTQASVCVCTQADATRVSMDSTAIHLSKYIQMCMEIHL